MSRSYVLLLHTTGYICIYINHPSSFFFDIFVCCCFKLTHGILMVYARCSNVSTDLSFSFAKKQKQKDSFDESRKPINSRGNSSVSFVGKWFVTDPLEIDNELKEMIQKSSSISSSNNDDEGRRDEEGDSCTSEGVHDENTSATTAPVEFMSIEEAIAQAGAASTAPAKKRPRK